MSTLISKRFVIRKSLIGKNQLITINFKKGKTVTYNHDKVYEVMKDKLEAMACWEKYKSYTSSTSVPVIARELLEQQYHLSKYYKWKRHTIEGFKVGSMSLSKEEIVKRARWFILDQCYLKNDKQREIVLNELISIIYEQI